MIDVVRNNKKPKLGFKKKAWMQAINDIKITIYFSNTIRTQKI